MANRLNEGGMPAEQGSSERGSTMDDRGRGHQEEDVRGIGNTEDTEFTEDTEDAEDAEDTDTEEDEEGSF
jgi:hypothetical protein